MKRVAQWNRKLVCNSSHQLLCIPLTVRYSQNEFRHGRDFPHTVQRLPTVIGFCCGDLYEKEKRSIYDHSSLFINHGNIKSYFKKYFHDYQTFCIAWFPNIKILYITIIRWYLAPNYINWCFLPPTNLALFIVVSMTVILQQPANYMQEVLENKIIS